MVLNYAESYQQAVDEKFAALRTSDKLWRTPANNSIDWQGANLIKIPTLTIDEGRRNRKRNNVTLGKMANYSTDFEPKKLSFDREWETSVDPRDVDDTNQVATIAKITAEFNRTQKVPEQDKFMFSTLYQEKIRIDGGQGNKSVVLDEKNVLSVFDDLMSEMDDSEVDGGRTLYITPAVNKLLKSADVTNRLAMVAGNGNIQRTVHSLDDVEIVVVPSARMKTSYDFESGAVAKEDAQQISMFLIADNIHVAPDKYNFAGLQEPTALTQGNYVYYESELSDVFMFDNKSKGYAAVIEPAQAKVTSSK